MVRARLIVGSSEVLEVFTTRPDTLFGATYMVIAPEHPQLQKLITPENELSVRSYVDAAASKSDLERTELQKDKSGVFTGSAIALDPQFSLSFCMASCRQCESRRSD